jgi:hypothetical protein
LLSLIYSDLQPYFGPGKSIVGDSVETQMLAVSLQDFLLMILQI